MYCLSSSNANNSTRYNISTRRETVVLHFQTRRKEFKMRHAQCSMIAMRLPGVWECGKTMSKIVHLSSIETKGKKKTRVCKIARPTVC